tara:strand:+ start:10861 stop:11157 length:297 start_codon:yes stop_codon:yes gene_type:complete
MKLYVGNLPFDTSEADLHEAFSEYLTDSESLNDDAVKIIHDRETKRSKGFGFVEMPSTESGEAAIKGMDGEDFNGRTLKVNEARPQEKRDDRRSNSKW